MIIEAVSKPLPGLSSQKTRKILWNNRRCAIAVLIALGAFGPTITFAGYSATHSSPPVAVLSDATRPGRQPISVYRIDPPNARPDLSEARIINDLYEKLMSESARVLGVRK